MPDFFANIPDTHVKVSRGFVDALIQTQREELLTGLMRLHYPSGEILIFTFLEGVQQNLYLSLEKSTDVIPRQSWAYSLDRPDASVAFLSLSVEGMRLMRVAYEAPIFQVEHLACSGDELAERTQLWASDQCPAIVHVGAGMINRIYLMAGNSAPIIEELSITGSATRLSLSDASFPKSLPRADYVVTRYISDSNHRVWEEYELRFAFHALVRTLLNRFSELAGRVLTERLCQQISLWLQEGGWSINVTLNGVTNRQYFESIEEAKSAYVEIIQRFNYEVSPAIGSRMADGILQEVLLKMSVHHQELLQRHVYDPYVTFNTPGKVRR